MELLGRSRGGCSGNRLASGCIPMVSGCRAAVTAPDQRHAASLYDKLGRIVLPLYYDDPPRWRWMMKQAIGNIAYYFNSQRMMRRYASEAYLR
jgi:starch phosphorylase